MSDVAARICMTVCIDQDKLHIASCDRISIGIILFRGQLCAVRLFVSAVLRVHSRDIDVAGNGNSPLRRQRDVGVGHGEAAVCVDGFVLKADKPAGENITSLGGNGCRGVDCFAFCILCTCKRRRTAIQIIADGVLCDLVKLCGVGDVAGDNAQRRSPALEGVDGIIRRSLIVMSDRNFVHGHPAYAPTPAVSA